MKDLKHFKILLSGIFILMLILPGCNKDDDSEFEGTNGSFTDSRDNHSYKWVKIGDQIWMGENLAYKPETGDYWAFNNDIENVAKYGYLYSWGAAKANCPQGWHLPTKDEWQKLTDFLGGPNVAGGKMKTTGTSDWFKPNEGATNESKFSALPAGLRYASGSFSFLGGHCRYWESNDPVFYELFYSNAKLNRSNFHVLETEGYSVRCIKD